jgi:hypothetical protein
LWLVTGYDPIATFESAWKNQHALLAEHANERPYPDTVWNDLLDFALASGWIGALLAVFSLIESVRDPRNPRSRLVLLCIAQPLFVAITALLASETARVWNFMLPLLILPAALQLVRMRLAEQLAVFLCLALIAAAVCRNLSMFMM